MRFIILIFSLWAMALFSFSHKTDGHDKLKTYDKINLNAGFGWNFVSTFAGASNKALEANRKIR